MAVCRNCWNFKVFGKRCWYFWENKSKCSQYREFADEEPRFKVDEAEL